jgi:hypothetical protein
MQRAFVVKGRMLTPTTVELAEPVTEVADEVEVLLRSAAGSVEEASETIFEFLRRLPPGARTKEDIDGQVREERDSWEQR